MKRLPHYDAQTSLAEQGAFLALTLVATALIFLTALDSARFACAPKDPFNSPAPDTALVEMKKAAGATNLTIAQPGPLGERSRLEGVSRPKS